MSSKRKRQVRITTFTILPVLLVALVAMIPAFLLNNEKADALTGPPGGEWDAVRVNIDSYIQSQAMGDPTGENGFLVTADSLQSRMDSNGDGTYLGEGDDAANAPILIDVLGGFTTLIPGTALRVAGPHVVSDASMGDANNYGPVTQAVVQAHRDAGFTDDIVTYCLTGHSQSRGTMAYGAVSAAGYFDDPATGGTEMPNVTGLKWGRQGWNYGATGAPSYTATNPLGAAEAPGAYATPANPNCTGKVDPELTRCTAQLALAATGGGGTPAGNPGTEQGVDVSNAPAASFLSGLAVPGPMSIQAPFATLFNSQASLSVLDPARQQWFYNATAHTSLMAAQGANMLGYNAKGVRWGIPAWNNTLTEKLPTDDPTAPDYYTLNTVAAWGGVDVTAPTITSGPTAGAITSTSADISRTTDEPATSKIDLTGSDTSTVSVNDTILNASKTVTVSGLNPGVTYSGTLTVCDGNANCSSAAVNFTTTCQAGKSTLSLSAPSAYWASMADYNNRLLSVDWTVSNTDATINAFNVVASVVSNTNGVTVSSGSPANLGDLLVTESAAYTVVYNIPVGVGSWATVNAATGDDECGTGYTYP